MGRPSGEVCSVLCEEGSHLCDARVGVGTKGGHCRYWYELADELDAGEEKNGFGIGGGSGVRGGPISRCDGALLAFRDGGRGRERERWEEARTLSPRVDMRPVREGVMGKTAAALPRPGTEDESVCASDNGGVDVRGRLEACATGAGAGSATRGFFVGLLGAYNSSSLSRRRGGEASRDRFRRTRGGDGGGDELGTISSCCVPTKGRGDANLTGVVARWIGGIFCNDWALDGSFCVDVITSSNEGGWKGYALC